ncbi:MAG TPA: hypothetical protein VFF68_03400 [Anaerolineaceae bacterium]|nr:hypothetical protein [Anaerolineaceae bacterium]
MRTTEGAVWIGRALIALVLVSNGQAAVRFLTQPEDYLAAYELIGPAGEVAVRGFGLLFLMWNVPYAVALLHPLRFRVSLVEAIGMQALAVVGESLIRLSIPAEHAILRASLLRFILFDSAGLAALLVAAWVSHGAWQRFRTQHSLVQ